MSTSRITSRRSPRLSWSVSIQSSAARPADEKPERISQRACRSEEADGPSASGQSSAAIVSRRRRRGWMASRPRSAWAWRPVTRMGVPPARISSRPSSWIVSEHVPFIACLPTAISARPKFPQGPGAAASWSPMSPQESGDRRPRDGQPLVRPRRPCPEGQWPTLAIVVAYATVR